MFHNSSSNSIGGVVFSFFGGLAFFVIGVFVTLFIGLPSLKQAKSSSDWPTVTGVVESATVVNRVKNGETHYRPEVTYRYTVENIEHTNSTIRMGASQTWLSNRAAARQDILQYPQGKELQVYYDPADPAVAALVPGAGGSSYFPLVFGVVFALVGLLLFGGAAIKFLLAGALVAGGLAALGKSKNQYRNNPMKQHGHSRGPEKIEIDEDAFDV